MSYYVTPGYWAPGYVVGEVFNHSKYSATDYAAAMRMLLPRGKVWPTDSSSTQSKVIDGLAITAQRSDSAAVDLVTGAFPSTADQLIPEWNKTLGLPDSGLGTITSTSVNRQQILTKLTATGGQSIAYFQSLASALGFTISITEFVRHTVSTPVSQPINGIYWPFGWKVTVLSSTTPSNLQSLKAIFNRYKPAHTVLYFP